MGVKEIGSPRKSDGTYFLSIKDSIWLKNLGFGIKYLDYSLNYAFVPYGDIGMTHRISLSIKLGNQIEK